MGIQWVKHTDKVYKQTKYTQIRLLIMGSLIFVVTVSIEAEIVLHNSTVKSKSRMLKQITGVCEADHKYWV